MKKTTIVLGTAIILMVGDVATPIVDQTTAILVKDAKSKIKTIVAFFKGKLTTKRKS
jgi:succinyl-CoA synthetase alpha subunit